MDATRADKVLDEWAAHKMLGYGNNHEHKGTAMATFGGQLGASAGTGPLKANDPMLDMHIKSLYDVADMNRELLSQLRIVNERLFGHSGIEPNVKDSDEAPRTLGMAYALEDVVKTIRSAQFQIQREIELLRTL